MEVVQVSISERGLAVLQAIVNDFVNDGEPVGSKSIVERHSFGVSAATIRNDMALLEEENLIVAPHTSSGRIPTDKGYRLYVDTLAEVRPLTPAQRTAIERFLGEAEDLDDVMSRTVRLLANLTNQAAVIQYPSSDQVSVRQVDLITVGPDRLLSVLILSSAAVEQQLIRLPHTQVDEQWVQSLRDRIAAEIIGFDVSQAQQHLADLLLTADIWASPREHNAVRTVIHAVGEQLQVNRNQKIAVAGTANLTRPGESLASLSAILEAIEEQVVLLRLIQELVADGRGLASSIGRENLPYGIPDTALLATSYELGQDSSSRLGVLGPTRMDYARSIASMRAVSRYLGKLLGETNL